MWQPKHGKDKARLQSTITNIDAIKTECYKYYYINVYDKSLVTCNFPIDTLKKMRLLDDKIIYMLNTTIPTESFKGQVDPNAQCKDLFQQIKSVHTQREQAIMKCLNIAKERVIQLKNLRENGDERLTLIKNLRNEQTTLRLLKAELNIEEVIKKRTVQIYYERCRGFYKPSHVNT